MLKESMEIFTKVTEYAEKMEKALLEGSKTAEEFVADIEGLMVLIKSLEKSILDVIYADYREFFESFYEFCGRCGDVQFLTENVDDMASSLALFEECMQEICNTYQRRVKKCACCGKEVIYKPLPEFYIQTPKQYGATYTAQSETLSMDEYTCPVCYSSDRDRLIVSYLKKIHIQKAAEGQTRVLQIAPARVIQSWLQIFCPHICYESTDLFMEGVTFRSDVQDMSTVADKTYDLIICSHVLEHVEDDRRALAEMKRVLKDDGQIVFLVPVDLSASAIDEEWGCSEEENWRRFGQGDHCRRYSKAGLLERLEEQFYVHSLGKEYFGEEVFTQCGLTDTSTLYVLTKSEAVELDMEEEIVIDRELCENGPLVSVILSCYNHEAFVAEAIESVINQSYKNIEFLVADDASQDGTAEIMKRYSKYYTKEFYFQDNAGSRGPFLLTHATGKYIALIHSDDVWDTDKLAVQIKYLEEHEGCDVCLSWCTYTDEALTDLDDNVFIQPNRTQQEWMRFFWEHGNVLCNPSSVIKRELRVDRYQRYGGECWQLPDFFKWVDLVQITSFYIVPKKLVRMRRHEGNASAATKTNLLRHSLEAGNHWIWVISDMEKEFFKAAFSDLMVDPDADTEEEILCEKYFLLKKHRNVFVQNSAMCYLARIWKDARTCFEEKYHYTHKEIKQDILETELIKKVFAEG